jgi:Fe-S oxidoreductase
VPLEKVNGATHVNVCLSIARYGFHAYSGGGRLAIGTALLDKRIEYSDKLLEVVYNCQLCGACDISCKYALDMEVLEPLYEIRASCVEAGRTLPILDNMIQGLRERGSLMPEASANLGHWADGVKVKELTDPDVEVVFLAGCRTSHNPQMSVSPEKRNCVAEAWPASWAIKRIF